MTSNQWKNWRIYDKQNNDSENIEDIFIVDELCKNKKAEEISKAKKEEIEKWIAQEVFDKVEDIGQERLSTTWVITTKMSEGKEITKARLVARGYEEDSSNIRSDSPTCQKANVRMLLAIAVAKHWTVRSLDIKAAF